MEQFSYVISKRLRKLAIGLPETSEGSSCVNRAFKVGKKNFLFVGEKDSEVRVMLRLNDSVDAAQALDDSRISVGKHGWITMVFAPDDAPDAALLEDWIVESFRGFATKKVLKVLDER